jgi:hypothetical protein
MTWQVPCTERMTWQVPCTERMTRRVDAGDVRESGDVVGCRG